MLLNPRKAIRTGLLVLRFLFFRTASVFTSGLQKRNISLDSVKSILVITQPRVGDAVMSLPFFSIVKKNLPKSKITALTNSYSKCIYEMVGEIDEIVEYRTGASIFEKIRIARSLKRNKFDLVFDLTTDYAFLPALCVFLVNPRYSIGYDLYGRGFLFNKRLKPAAQSVHIVDQILEIAVTAGFEAEERVPSLVVDSACKEIAERFLKDNNADQVRMVIGIHPGGHYQTQRWPEDKFAETADRLLKRYDTAIVLIGGTGEEKIVRRIESFMSSKPLLFINQPLKNLVSIIDRCDILVCNNSGPLHIAAAVGTPTVSTMGPTVAKRWWPRGENNIVIRKDIPCIGCNSGWCRIKTHECMSSITVNDVLEAVEKLIQ